MFNERQTEKKDCQNNFPAFNRQPVFTGGQKWQQEDPIRYRPRYWSIFRDSNFPTSKSKLIENARQELGPDTNEVIDLLSRLKKEEYSTPAELMHEVGRIS